MVSANIPGFRDSIELHHLVVDFNGTLAVDGKLINGVKKILRELSNTLHLHVVTGNSTGTAKEELSDISCTVVILPQEHQDSEKAKYVSQLGGNSVISIGNGRNDRSMLKTATIGIIVIQEEGASSEALMAADIVCTNILDALALIQKPLRLKSTLRS